MAAAGTIFCFYYDSRAAIYVGQDHIFVVVCTAHIAMFSGAKSILARLIFLIVKETTPS